MKNRSLISLIYAKLVCKHVLWQKPVQ